MLDITALRWIPIVAIFKVIWNVTLFQILYYLLYKDIFTNKDIAKLKL